MAIRTKANYQSTYLTVGGQWPDNISGDITAADLRAGIQDYFDSQTSDWYLDTSGILGSDGSGFMGADFKSDAAAPAWREGRVFYDSYNHCFASYNDISGVTHQIGQETYVRIINQTASQIDDGTCVEIISAGNALPSIRPAIADSTTIPDVIGFATHDIAAGTQGFVTINGMIHNQNTAAFSVGDKLYLSPTTSGAVTNVEPDAPNPAILVGYVIVDHASAGRVLVHVECAHRIEELANVNGTTAQEGYLLGYNLASGYWDATDRINTSGGFKFGDVDAGNYSEFQEDTGFIRGYGSGVAWDDLRFQFTSQQRGFVVTDFKPDFDETNIGYLFPQNDETEISYTIAQMPHDWVTGTDVHPHIHYIQDEATPAVFKMDYRWYPIGGQVPSFTTVQTSGILATPYVSGTIHQLTTFPWITPPANVSGVSSIIDIKIYRATGDGVTGDVLAKEFDIHYQKDSFGSRQEYVR